MGIIADFEDRIASTVEGLFAGAFKSPVQPVEIAKALGRAADDARVLGVATVYAPTAYSVALSPADDENLGAFKPTLAGELSSYLVDHARERGYLLSSRPSITFEVHDDLRLGRFRVRAALAEQPREAPVEVPRAATPSPGPAVDPTKAVLTVGDTGARVELTGDELIVGRVAESDIRITDANVSRRHAAFIRLDDGWAIVDLGSTNGTRLNGSAVERARLRDGDVVEIGLTRILYNGPGQ